ncbi:SipW-dependent-type signal peptide-containing protein [Trujillonella endophytica]|uniref:SipW-cognate class signal peptide n=1 Tax=Trujillonella endophytica TaxID=673521 RepID=A0A1H8PH89_9ACTN|nr:SipW-dependent-type signal peptide-containing protein [Trujillella endophytica]SEO41300.1 SipW-cognate class signal peptide [Trujillella endophytica]
MRQQTQWALGGVLAGTVLLGVTGTLAVFSDTESASADVGARALDLLVTADLHDDGSGRIGPLAQHTVSLQASVGAGSAGVLTLSIEDGPADCADLPPVQLSITAASLSSPVAVSACSLRTTPLPIGRLDAGTPAVTVVVGMIGRTAGAKGPASWDGELRLALAQDGGGFTDTEVVPVHVVGPPGQAVSPLPGTPPAPPTQPVTPVGPGNGNSNGNGNGGGNGNGNGRP